MAYINIDSEGRITAASETHHCGPDEIEVNIPDEIGIESIDDYRFIDGEFIFDPKEKEEEEGKPTLEERIAALEDENLQLKEALDLLLSGATEDGEEDG